jgi:hypothetical protein
MWSWDAVETEDFSVELENGQFFPQIIRIVLDDHRSGDLGGSRQWWTAFSYRGGTESAGAGSHLVTIHSPATAVQSAAPQYSGQSSGWNHDMMDVYDSDDYDETP